MKIFKRGDKVDFKGNGNSSPLKETYVWSINPHLNCRYVIEHPDGSPQEFFFATQGSDGFESIHSSDLIAGKKYIYVTPEEIDFSLTPMKRNEDGIILVYSLKDLRETKWYNEMFIYAVCPKCKDGTISIYPNAYKILTKGCLFCVDGTGDDWSPKISILNP